MPTTSHDERQTEAGLEMPKAWEPYREISSIRSAGRTPLTSAFSLYMALTGGLSPHDIASCFDVGGDAGDREFVEREIHFLAGLFVEENWN